MLKKIVFTLIGLLIVFLAYVSTKDGHFHYERSTLVQAPADRIYPFISDFKKGVQWNPYDQKDPQMKHTYLGPEGKVGSTVEFEGNREAGSGRLEITKAIPNQLVEMKLTMTKPFRAENLVRYQLTPEGTRTRFTWSMEGDGGFLGKLMSTLIDCEKMITADFEKGFVNLRSIFEK